MKLGKETTGDFGADRIFVFILENKFSGENSVKIVTELSLSILQQQDVGTGAPDLCRHLAVPSE